MGSTRKAGPVLFKSLKTFTRRIHTGSRSFLDQTIDPFSPEFIQLNNQQTNPTINSMIQPSVLSKPGTDFCRMQSTRISRRKLFNPDVLNVSDRVKNAMLTTDPGLRHSEYIYAVDFLRNSILRIARATVNNFSVVPVNGSGTLAMESTIRTMLRKRNGKVIVLSNGWQGNEVVQICESSGIDIVLLSMDIKQLQDTLVNTNEVSGVVVVHCEWLSGLVNPVNEIGETVKKMFPDCFFIVDATVTFGSLPLNMSNIDFLIGDSCKSLQGAPGMAFVIARRESMSRQEFNTDSLVMDLAAQYNQLETTGEMRFTPPIHILNALKEAIMELSDEGGIQGRALRYKENNELLKKGMNEMGFEQYFLNEENPEGFISTSYLVPMNPLFVLNEFRSRLSDCGFLLTENNHLPKNSFCVGNIGNLNIDDVNDFLQNVRQVCQDMRMMVPIRDEHF